MRGNPVLQVRLPPQLAEQLRLRARSRGKELPDYVRQLLQEDLARAGFEPIRTHGAAPRLEEILRKLAHRGDVVCGSRASWLRILSEGYASPQPSRRRGRFAWCVDRTFLVLVRSDYYRLNTGEVHRRLCPASCEWLAGEETAEALPAPSGGGLHP